MESSISLFEGKKVRHIWHNNEWWFVVEDIVYVLTDSVDPKGYIKDMRRRDEELSKGWVQIATTLSVQTAGGMQSMNCTNTEGAFRIIQSIPSKKAEPFKLWLAKVGYERLKEIENPELAQERMKHLYEQKGYPKEWIDKRLRGIAVRQELTEEWKNRGVNENIEYGILTNEISKATFGKTVDDYKKLKNLRNENLRDHMNDLELIFTMLGEASTTKIAKSRNAQGFTQNKVSAIKGGTIAGNARKNLEIESGEKVVTNENYLDESESKKKIRYKKKNN